MVDLFGARIEEAATNPGLRDYKTRLQELAARLFDEAPDYLVVEEGPDHAKSFHATVSIAGSAAGRGPRPLQEAGPAVRRPRRLDPPHDPRPVRRPGPEPPRQ